jgi:hypothetical protein
MDFEQFLWSFRHVLRGDIDKMQKWIPALNVYKEMTEPETGVASSWFLQTYKVVQI